MGVVSYIEVKVWGGIGSRTRSRTPDTMVSMMSDDDDGNDRSHAEYSINCVLQCDDDDDDDDDEDDAEDAAPPPPKRLCVEPTPPEKLANRPTTLVQFDQRVLRKTYLELLNLQLSKHSHTSVTMWTSEATDERAALAMLEKPGGFWVHHFPVAEIDHVWRLLVNAHLQSKSFGCVASLTATSFEVDAGCEVEIRMLVRDARELVELKRIGAGLLAVAPGTSAGGGSSSGSGGRPCVFFVSEPLKAGAAGRLSRTRLEEKSTYKLQKEKRSSGEATDNKEARRYSFDTERLVNQLYKVETSSPITWVKVVV